MTHCEKPHCPGIMTCPDFKCLHLKNAQSYGQTLNGYGQVIDLHKKPSGADIFEDLKNGPPKSAQKKAKFARLVRFGATLTYYGLKVRYNKITVLLLKIWTLWKIVAANILAAYLLYKILS